MNIDLLTYDVEYLCKHHQVRNRTRRPWNPPEGPFLVTAPSPQMEPLAWHRGKHLNATGK